MGREEYNGDRIVLKLNIHKEVNREGE